MEKKKLLEDYHKEIKQLENIALAIHAKGVSRNEATGTIEVKMSPNQLGELADVKRKIFQMKREALALEEEIEDDED